MYNQTTGGDIHVTGTVNVTYPQYGEKTQLSLLIRDDGIDVVHRQEPMVYYSCINCQQPPPRISKSIYRIVDGKLTFIKEIEGRYVAPRGEWYEFDVEEEFRPAY